MDKLLKLKLKQKNQKTKIENRDESTYRRGNLGTSIAIGISKFSKIIRLPSLEGIRQYCAS
jgi:hypothetical protein